MHACNVRSSHPDKHGCDCHDAVNRIENYLKVPHHDILSSRFQIKHSIEGASVCDVASKIAEAMTTKLTMHNAVEQFVQTFIVLQTTRAHDVIVRFIEASLVRCLLSLLSAIPGWWDLSRRFI